MMTRSLSRLPESRKRRRSIDDEGRRYGDVRYRESTKQTSQLADHTAGRTPTHKYSDLALNMSLALIDFEDEQDRNRFELDAPNRWNHPLQRGAAGGRREMIVASQIQMWDSKRPRPPLFFAAWDAEDRDVLELQERWHFKYEGPATIWGSLNQLGELVVRVWPDNWERE